MSAETILETNIDELLNNAVNTESSEEGAGMTAFPPLTNGERQGSSRPRRPAPAPHTAQEAAIPSLPAQGGGSEPQERTEVRMVYDAVADKWEEKRVPVGRVESLLEPEDAFQSDPLGLGAEWDNGRGQGMTARWVNVNPKYQTNARQEGLAPVRPEDFASKRYRHHKVEGIEGKCVTYGDLVLMEIPTHIDNTRYARRIANKKSEMHEMLYGLTEQAADLAQEDGVTIENQSEQYVGEADWDNGGATFGESGGYAEAEASAEIESLMSAAGANRGGRTFGGLAGNPQYNKVNPTGPKPNYGYRAV